MGEIVKKTYVLFWYRGAFFDETSKREVFSRDLLSIEIPQKAYAFEFYDEYEMTIEVEERQIVLRSDAKPPINRSPRYFVGGDVYTIEELPEQLPVLQENMKANGWEQVIRTSAGHFLPFLDGDVVLDIGRSDEC